MQIVNCTQGSSRWLLARLGRPTASRFGDIVTTTGKPSKAAARDKYLWQLVGERLTGRTTEHFESDAMRRGTALEPIARDWYVMQSGNKVDQVGFVYGDGGKWGCSPDALVGDDGGLEIKCPTLVNYLQHLMIDGVPSHWQVQIQACLWITERDWWDFVLFTDSRNVPSVVRRVERNDEVIDALAENVPAFCDELDEREAALRERYELPPREAVDIEAASGDWCPWPDEALTDE